MDKLNLIQQLNDNYTSILGKLKTRKLPITIKQSMILYTCEYTMYVHAHMAVRHNMLINNAILPVCKYCGSTIQVKSVMQLYNQQFCSASCSSSGSLVKREQTCMKRYGVTNASKTDNVKDKITETSYNRYGAKRASSTQAVITKIKKTTLEKYGVSHTSKLTENRNKAKETSMLRYGVSNFSKTEKFKTDFKEISILRYGVTNPSKSNDVIAKIKITKLANHGNAGYVNPLKAMQTNLCRYGVKHPQVLDVVKDKAIATNIERYNGYKWPTQCHIAKDNLDILHTELLFKSFIVDKTPRQAAIMLGISVDSIYPFISMHGATHIAGSTESYLETTLRDFLISQGINFIQNTRTIITPLELDFYLPDYNLAIEMNGDYWHSDKFRHKNYHYNKWKMCQDKNIHLVSMFETMFNDNTQKYKDLVLSLVHRKITTIGARKTQIKKITAKEARPFVDKYHLQNFVGGSSHFGAFYNGNLVAVMTFGNTRNQRFELKRFVTGTNASYPGLFSKMFKYAQQELKFTEVVSFSDNRWFTGNVYEKTGFYKTKDLGSAYSYLYKGKLMHMQNFTKSRIANKFPKLAESIANGMSEATAMDTLGILRIYDCGKKEWVWQV